MSRSEVCQIETVRICFYTPLYINVDFCYASYLSGKLPVRMDFGLKMGKFKWGNFGGQIFGFWGFSPKKRAEKAL